MMQELDFNQELNNNNIARSYAEQTEVYIPAPYAKYSSKKLLVMEFFEGVKFKEILSEAKYDRKRIARQGLQTVVQQILEDGFFHADPHPGNLLVGDDMRLCIIDWGMIGRLTERDRFMLIEMLTAIVDKNSEGLAKIFLQLCKTSGRLRIKILWRGTCLLYSTAITHYPIKNMDIGRLLRSLLALLRDHNLRLPTDMVVMIKALVTAEGSARLVFPELNVIEELKGSVHRLALERYRPGVIWRNLRNILSNFLSMQRELPRQLLQIIEKIEGGQLSFIFHLGKT